MSVISSSQLILWTWRLPEDTPSRHPCSATSICHSLGRLPDPSWRRCPGRPRNRWLDQLHGDNYGTPPVDLWPRPSRVDTWGWRYGSRRLRVNDERRVTVVHIVSKYPSRTNRWKTVIKLFLINDVNTYQVYDQRCESDHSCQWLHNDTFHLSIQWPQ